MTIKDAYTIPRIYESLSKLGDAKFFTTLDLGSAFWQVPLRKKDREMTGFACELGLYEWKRMSMAQALTRMTKKCYVVIATPTLENHIDLLDEVFDCMKRAGLKRKPSKFEILRDSSSIWEERWTVEVGTGSSGGCVDMEGSQNGHETHEL